MVTIKAINKQLKQDNLPIELCRGTGYHYFIYERGNVFETESVMVYRLSHLTFDEWVRIGRQFAMDTEHKYGIY